MKKILLIFGTRPEAIKLCPLVHELRARRELQTVICVSGQHREMLAQVLKAFEVTPDYDLDVMLPKQSLSELTMQILAGIEEVLNQECPDLVIVHGDTTTALSSALACFYKSISIGHVEAGLRTYRITSPFPEEFNRQAIDLMAQYYFAPTPLARKNLIREGKPSERIFVTGNTGIDALRSTVRKEYTHPYLEWAKDSRLLLITAHRRENIGEPMRNMFAAIRRIMEAHGDVKAIYPIHLNPAVRKIVQSELGNATRIQLIDPLDVVDFHNFMARCHLILTDSGGVQEEAPSLGKPVLVMRDTTERMEGIAAGTLKLVGTEEDTIFQAVHQLLSKPREYAKMAKSKNPYGDGYASKRIADILCAELVGNT